MVVVVVVVGGSIFFPKILNLTPLNYPLCN